jgi:hypothetical protein
MPLRPRQIVTLFQVHAESLRRIRPLRYAAVCLRSLPRQCACVCRVTLCTPLQDIFFCCIVSRSCCRPRRWRMPPRISAKGKRASWEKRPARASSSSSSSLSPSPPPKHSHASFRGGLKSAIWAHNAGLGLPVAAAYYQVPHHIMRGVSATSNFVTALRSLCPSDCRVAGGVGLIRRRSPLLSVLRAPSSLPVHFPPPPALPSHVVADV